MTDYKRWSNPLSLQEAWDTRTMQLAALIPEQKIVFEFGSGRMVLEKYLHSSCTYIPSDVIKRAPNMIECDLNCNDHFERIPNHDVTVFSGVMEYINDLPSVVNKLSTKTNNIVCSYAVKTDLATLDKRTKNGWVNHYTKIELLKLFDNNNFNCIHMSTWNTQLILQFEKNK